MDCSLVAPAAFCSTLIPLTTEPFFHAHLPLFLTITNNNIFQCLYPTPWPTAFPVSSPDPQFLMDAQPWKQPTDLTQAKNLLGRLRSSITRRAREEFVRPKAKIQSVLLLTHTAWSKLEQEILDNLITYGCANATHWCLRHNPAGVNGVSDKACIHLKKARFTLSRVMVKSKYSIDIKEEALLLWINKFLPKYNKGISFMKGSSRSCVTGSVNRATPPSIPPPASLSPR